MNLADTAAERAFLGCVLFTNAALDSADIQIDDFTDTKNRNIFAAISRIIAAGQEANQITLTDDLRKAETPIDLDYLAKLQMMPTGANAIYYAKKIRELSRKRHIFNLCRSLAGKLDSAAISSETLIEEMETTLTEIVDKGTSDISEIGKAMGPVWEMIQRRHDQYVANGNQPVPDGIESGYRSIDYLSNGFADGNLVIIGARPSIGKTAIALNIAVNVAERGIKCGFFSCEMTQTQLITRMLSGLSCVEHRTIHQGAVKETKDWKVLLESSDRIVRFPILIDDTANISLSLLKSRARKMRRMGAQIIFIDYLTLIRHGDTKMPRYERVGEISKSLKMLARELSIPIIAMSQLGREAEGQVPTLANMRQSGEIEEDADVIILMNRDRDSESDSIPTDFDIAKNRHGETGKVQLIFKPRFVRFYELESAEKPIGPIKKPIAIQKKPEKAEKTEEQEAMPF